MALLFDQHLHSRHSFDSSAEPVANVGAALAEGLAGLTFTEHFDCHPLDWKQCVYDHDAYSATIESLRARFGGQIFIGQGIEICYQPDHMDFVLDFLSRHEFDLVILSVHYADGKGVHRRASWQDSLAGTRSYLETVLTAVRCCAEMNTPESRVFDVLGHLDLAKRYTQRFFGTYDMTVFAGLISDILTACLEADIIPEINTSTLRQGLTETMPGAQTVAEYARLGGRAMSLGSDAHQSVDVGAGLDHACDMLRASGMAHTAVFRGRHRTEVPLD